MELPLAATRAPPAVALSVKLGAAVTVRAIVVLAESEPLVPFTVSAYEPAATPAATLIVTAELLVAGFVPNVPVMPDGQFEAASVTGELNPLAGFTITVELPLAPACALAAVALSVKPGEPPGDTLNVPNCSQAPAL